MSDLVQRIQDNSTSIESVYKQVPEIPLMIWHLLMTDSAERALHMMAKKDLIIDERLTAVLWVKRRWAVGEASTNQLNRARRAATALEEENVRRYPSWNYYTYESTPKSNFLVPREGIKIVEYATRKRLVTNIPNLLQFGVAWPWQRERLQGLCELAQFTDRLLLAYEDADLPVELVSIDAD